MDEWGISTIVVPLLGPSKTKFLKGISTKLIQTIAEGIVVPNFKIVCHHHESYRLDKVFQIYLLVRLDETQNNYVLTILN